MKKIIFSIALLFTFVSVFAQTWTNTGNALQQQTNGTYKNYRFNLGSPGFLNIYSKFQIDSINSSAPGIHFPLVFGTGMISGHYDGSVRDTIKTDTGFLQTVAGLFPRADTRYYTKTYLNANFAQIDETFNPITGQELIPVVLPTGKLSTYSSLTFNPSDTSIMLNKITLLKTVQSNGTIVAYGPYIENDDTNGDRAQLIAQNIGISGLQVYNSTGQYGVAFNGASFVVGKFAQFDWLSADGLNLYTKHHINYNSRTLTFGSGITVGTVVNGGDTVKMLSVSGSVPCTGCILSSDTAAMLGNYIPKYINSTVPSAKVFSGTYSPTGTYAPFYFNPVQTFTSNGQHLQAVKIGGSFSNPGSYTGVAGVSLEVVGDMAADGDIYNSGTVHTLTVQANYNPLITGTYNLKFKDTIGNIRMVIANKNNHMTIGSGTLYSHMLDVDGTMGVRDTLTIQGQAYATAITSSTPTYALGLDGSNKIVKFTPATTTGYVPYVGATTDVNLGSNSLILNSQSSLSGLPAAGTNWISANASGIITFTGHNGFGLSLGKGHLTAPHKWESQNKDGTYADSAFVATKADSASLYGVKNDVLTTLKTTNSNLATANTATFGDGSAIPYIKAAPAYGTKSFLADTWYIEHAYPTLFSSTFVMTLANKYITNKDVSGNFPVLLDGTTGAPTYFSGCDLVDFQPPTDGAFYITEMYLLYYQKTADISYFNTNAATIKQALDNVPLDGNGLVNVSTTAAQNYIPWVFQDGVRSTGDNLMGTLLYWKACVDMATMYTINGQTSLASTMTARATAITTNITSQLWDSTDGMFYAAGTNNRQIDVLGSAYAAYLGVATSSQITSISTYLVNNYSTLTQRGYIHQSNTNWGFSWSGNQCGKGTGNYDDGVWSVGNEWVTYALYQTSQPLAYRYVSEFMANPDPTQEYYGLYTNGVTNNTESPAGTLAFVNLSGLYNTGTSIARFVPGATPVAGAPLVSQGNGLIGIGSINTQWTPNGSLMALSQPYTGLGIYATQDHTTNVSFFKTSYNTTAGVFETGSFTLGSPTVQGYRIGIQQSNASSVLTNGRYLAFLPSANSNIGFFDMESSTSGGVSFSTNNFSFSGLSGTATGYKLNFTNTGVSSAANISGITSNFILTTTPSGNDYLFLGTVSDVRKFSVDYTGLINSQSLTASSMLKSDASKNIVVAVANTDYLPVASPVMTTPTLGVATATSINKVTITAPATSATLTLAQGSSLVTSGANSITLTSTGATNVTLPTSGTLVSSVTTGNGVSATNTAGALAFTLGNITPTTVVASGSIYAGSGGYIGVQQGSYNAAFVPATLTAIQTVTMPNASGNLTLNLANSQTTLVAGTKAITITGLTSSGHAYLQFVSQGGVSTTTFQYAAVCSANTLTITAETTGGATNTSDTSVLNYFVTPN